MTIGELVAPSTDGGALVLVIVTIVVVAGLIWLVRRERSLVLLVVGIGMVVLAFYGFRTLH